MKNWGYFALVVIAIFCDQVSKGLVLSTIPYGARLAVIPGWFDLTLLYNKGVAFSLFAENSGWTGYLVAVLAVIVCAYMAYTIMNDKFNVPQKIAGALVIAGAVGNIVDRALYGHVVDFLLFYHGSYSYPVFNLADSFITLGAIILIFEGIVHQRAGTRSNARDE